MKKGIYLMGEGSFESVYPKDIREEIAELIEIEDKCYNQKFVEQNPEILEDKSFIMSSWGMIKLEEKILKHCPILETVFYGAGSIRYFTTDEMWDKNITVCSAYGANGVAVTEFTLAEILFSLKRGWFHMNKIKKEKTWHREKIDGVYKSKIGIISLGMIGTMVAKRLQSFDVEVLAYDIFQSEEKAKSLNIRYTSLEEIFSTCDVVSLHTPWLKETENMIQGKHFSLMKENATFINTARGAVINEAEMIEVLQKRQDIFAILDVTYPNEPPLSDSPLYTMDNVIMTPHIAGAVGRECGRMGFYMLEELKKYLNNQPLEWSISKEKAKTLA